MKLKLVLSALSFALFASIAQAETKMETVESWFAQGQPVTFEEAKGFYSGRCFSWAAPDTARPIALAYKVKERPEGPGFPGDAEVRMSLLTRFNVPADFFDTYSNVSELAESLSHFWEKVGPPTDSPTLTWTYDFEPNGRIDEKDEIVRYGEYLVSKTTLLIRQSYKDAWSGRSERLQAGRVLLACYYFKKLAE